jgi:hypothetical protein
VGVLVLVLVLGVGLVAGRVKGGIVVMSFALLDLSLDLHACYHDMKRNEI